MGGGFAAGGGDLVGGECLGEVNTRGPGRGPVVGGLVFEEGMRVGVAIGGNTILRAIGGSTGLLERTNGASVSPLVSARADRTARVGEKGLMGRLGLSGPRLGLVGIEASGNGARVLAGEMLRYRAGNGASDIAREGTLVPCGGTPRDSMSRPAMAEPPPTSCSSICTMAPLLVRDETEGWLLGLR